MNLEKIHGLRRQAAQQKRRLQSLRRDILIISAQISDINASREGLKYKDMAARRDLEQEIDRQVSELKQKKAKLQNEEKAWHDELQAITSLLQSCETYLAQRGIPIPENQDELKSFPA